MSYTKDCVLHRFADILGLSYAQVAAMSLDELKNRVAIDRFVSITETGNNHHQLPDVIQNFMYGLWGYCPDPTKHATNLEYDNNFSVYGEGL